MFPGHFIRSTRYPNIGQSCGSSAKACYQERSDLITFERGVSIFWDFHAQASVERMRRERKSISECIVLNVNPCDRQGTTAEDPFGFSGNKNPRLPLTAEDSSVVWIQLWDLVQQ